jgi:hypothetical protein
MAELMAVSLPCGLATALSSRRRSRLAVMALGAMGPPRVFGRSLRLGRRERRCEVWRHRIAPAGAKGMKG